MSGQEQTCAAPPENVATSRGNSAIAVRAKMKLLVVDDGAANLELLRDILADSGYTRVLCVNDSREVLAACESFGPDLVLLDLMMPHIDGFTLLETIRTNGADRFVPVIVLTGDATHETKRRALVAGATDFLLKPFDCLEVILRIGNLLELRHLQMQLDNQCAALEHAVRERSEELRDAQAQLARAAA